LWVNVWDERLTARSSSTAGVPNACIWTSATPSDAHTSSSKSRHRFTRLYRRVGCAGWTRGSEECKRRSPGLARGLVSIRDWCPQIIRRRRLSPSIHYSWRATSVLKTSRWRDLRHFRRVASRRVAETRDQLDEIAASIRRCSSVRRPSVCLSVSHLRAACSSKPSFSGWPQWRRCCHFTPDGCRDLSVANCWRAAEQLQTDSISLQLTVHSPDKEFQIEP